MKYLLIILCLSLISCEEPKYNKLVWEKERLKVEVEILKIQITLDSLKSLHEKATPSL